ncbi:MAG: NAD(P)-dependent alcohol dehydrogenase [Pseudolabrys sp.]
MKITAAVVRERGGAFGIEALDLADPHDDELLVEVKASGMCATDLHGRDGYFATMPFPAVFGHEGAGIVRAVGKSVSDFKPGDRVVMSYPWCGTCPNCLSHRQNYCLSVRQMKMSGKRPDGSTLHAQNGRPVYGAFFQQSSFGNFAIANEKFAVKVPKAAPIELLGPLACGGQTGAGAVLNVMKPAPGDSFGVFGVGSVGLSGLMAAKIAGCDPIIAVDVHDHRLAPARELGATHIINHTGRTDVVAEIRKITGHGLRFSLETSAQPSVLREAIEALMPAATCVLLGSARAGTDACFEMPFLQPGRSVRGVVQGDSQPKEFIPLLIEHMAAGRFPLERLITFYDLADINRAAADSESGKTIKPVLRMPH